MMPKIESKFLTVKEAAAYLRIAPSTLYGWRNQGKIQGRKHGGRLVFAVQVLDNFGIEDQLEPSSFHPWGKSVKRADPRKGRSSLTTEESSSRSHSCHKEADNGL